MQTHSPPDIRNLMTAFAVVWGMGAQFGSGAGGWAMSGFSPHGLPISIAAVYSLLVAGLGIRGRYAASK